MFITRRYRESMRIKPHIWKHNDEMWTCEGVGTWHVGWTPIEAYNNWLERLHKLAQRDRVIRGF